LFEMIAPDTTLLETPQGDAPVSAGAGDWARPLLERQLSLVGELAELGLNVARSIERQATAPASDDGSDDGSAHDGAAPPVLGDIGLAYARVARAVRLTVMLQSKLIEGLQALDRGETDSARWLRECDTKKRVERIVERVIRAEHDDEEVVDHLTREGAERLDEDDIYGDVLTRPVSETVAVICRALGLAPDWAHLAEEAWAQEEMASGAAGSPLAALMAEHRAARTGASGSPPPPPPSSTTTTTGRAPFQPAPHAASP
jgi:hypothetical protein